MFLVCGTKELDSQVPLSNSGCRTIRFSIVFPVYVVCTLDACNKSIVAFVAQGSWSDNPGSLPQSKLLIPSQDPLGSKNGEQNSKKITAVRNLKIGLSEAVKSSLLRQVFKH